jgi:hypothetical protein
VTEATILVVTSVTTRNDRHYMAVVFHHYIDGDAPDGVAFGNDKGAR